jgi:hypothetical protein
MRRNSATKKTPTQASWRHFASVPPGIMVSGNNPTTVPTRPPMKIEPRSSLKRFLERVRAGAVADVLPGNAEDS